MLAIIIVVVLTLGVIFVNGWTDAPNAIATAVSTRVLPPSFAVKMAVVMNFAGALVMTLLSSKVATTLSTMVSFDESENDKALIVLAAGMVAIVTWAILAWKFGIPTSESHALIAGVSGAALALGGANSINGDQWVKVLLGLVISSVLGFGAGFLCTKLIEAICKNIKRSKANKFFHWAEALGAAFMAFLHGAQDGQKFMGIFLLGVYLYNSSWVGTNPDGSFIIPFWLVLLCSVTMGLGTSIGGYRIIKAVGMDMVKLEKYQGFSADVAASLCLFFSTLSGIPISTTHTKTTAIMGVGASKRLRAVNWAVVKEMVLAWILTFPGCGIIAFGMAKLFLLIF